MVNTEKFGIIGLGEIRSTKKWGTGRKEYSESGDAWNLLRRGAPDLPQQEVTR